MTVSSDDGGEADRLAPVIPLFGAGARPVRQPAEAPVDEPVRSRDETPRSAIRESDESRDGRAERDASQRWHTTWTRDSARGPGGGGSSDAPVALHPAATRERDRDASTAGDDDVRGRAERMLLRKLRTRSLSIREARAALRDADVDGDVAEQIIEAFEQNGYLDDARLAEQLLDGALGRKAQGATAIAQTLARRGLDRDVIDIAMASLPDDEAERAGEFARQRARGMSGLDRDVALRRLHGQLARRGFSGPVALDAARRALDEAAD